MRGTVLDFSPDQFTGLVSGEDGRRYRLSGADWRGAIWPVQGEAVDFVTDGMLAREVFPFLVRSEPMRWRHFLFSLEGRIARRQYWLHFFLPYCVFVLVLDLIEFVIRSVMFNIVYFIISLILIWPSIAVTAKRCHDRDRSGWFQLIALIPVVGTVWLLIEIWFLRGTAGPNRFGPDPLQRAGS